MTSIPSDTRSQWAAALSVALAVLVGGALVADNALRSSATYDEVAYLRIGCEWWRTGKHDRIARMGSPLTFWKLQQAPVLFALDRAGFGDLTNHPIERQSSLLPLVRLGSLWIWSLALLLTAGWAACELGPRAAACAAWWFALSPNLIAHGSLATMELPLVATSAALLWSFSLFLKAGHAGWFWLSAAIAGLAFSCKFTAILLPPLLGLAWLIHRLGTGEPWLPATLKVARAMAAFLLIMALSNVLVTAGTLLPLSEQHGDHPALANVLGPVAARRLEPLLELPLPQDLVGFARQMQHQRSGGPSYLRGQVRQHGWWYYYLVCLALKMPLGVAVLWLGRLAWTRLRPLTTGERLGLVVILGTVAITALGSSRNYGFRYLLFLAPAAILGISALAEAGKWPRRLLALGLLGQALAVAASHPHELTYFNQLVGGAEGGKYWLSDSNLDWGQGARALARLQASDPRLQDLTLYYFGDTDPAHYGVTGKIHLIDAHGPVQPLPAELSAKTRFIGVSRSLQYGPWGPPGYFDELPETPVSVTDDHTIAIYQWPPGQPPTPRTR